MSLTRGTSRQRKLAPHLLLAASFLLACGWNFGQEPTVNALLFSHSAEAERDSTKNAISLLTSLPPEEHIRVEATEDPGAFNDEFLSQFDVVLFLNTRADVLDAPERAAMERFIRSGKGYVGVHSAIETSSDWPWMGQLVGAYATEHPNRPVQVQVTTEAPGRPSTRHLPPRFSAEEAIHRFDRNLRLDHEILLAARPGESPSRAHQDADASSLEQPISWRKQFDGGRSWVTALGHRKETWQNPLFLRHLTEGIRWAGGKNRWNRIRLTQAPRNPTALDVAEDGRVFWIERSGELRIWDPATARVSLAGSFEVSRKGENGLLGLALAPDFSESGVLYLYYSAPDTEEFEAGQRDNLGENRLARFHMAGPSKLDLSSEKILLRVPSTRLVHEGGDLEFGPGGKLYLSLGDNTNPFADLRKFPPRDKRPGREAFNAERTAGSPFDLRGSILRLEPDGKPAPNNLYPADGSLGRPEIFVSGTRNPFRMAIDPETGRVFWGDVGPDAFVDTPRGPRGFDEINFADKPGNYGWPRCIGFNLPYANYDYETQLIGPRFSCDEYEPALLAYDYTNVDYPALGRAFADTDEIRTGRTAIAGVVYRPPPGPAPFALPESHHGRLLMTEWTRNLIVSVDVSEDGELGEVRRVAPWEAFASPIDLDIAPDGALYVLEYGTQFGGDNSDAGLTRLEYSEVGALTPIARITASPTSAEAGPVAVKFSGAASTAPNDEVTGWAWDFDDDGNIDARGIEAAHTFVAEGVFPVTLTVRSRSGRTSFPASKSILVGHSPPTVTIHRPPQGAVARAGTSIALLGSAVDAQKNPIPCEDLVWGIRLGHNSHSHPIGEIQGKCSVRFVPDVSGHEDAEELFYVLELTVKELKDGKETGLIGKAMRILPIVEPDSR